MLHFWNELRDPFTGESLDLAFVITIPEPAGGVLVLVGFGGLALCEATPAHVVHRRAPIPTTRLRQSGRNRVGIWRWLPAGATRRDMSPILKGGGTMLRYCTPRLCRSVCFLVAAAAGWLCTARVEAVNYIPIDFSSQHNDRLQNLDAEYPSGSVELGGIPFHIPTAAEDEFNFWHSYQVEGENPRSITIPIGMDDVLEVHTLINTAWGQPSPASYAKLIFTYGHGIVEHDLIGDDDIRDWRQNTWTNSINGTTTVNVVSLHPETEEHRLDKQFFDVSGASMMTLINIRLEDNGADPFFQRAFLAGLTIGVIPEPTTLTLLALASLVLFRRPNPGPRRRRPMT